MKGSFIIWTVTNKIELLVLLILLCGVTKLFICRNLISCSSVNFLMLKDTKSKSPFKEPRRSRALVQLLLTTDVDPEIKPPVVVAQCFFLLVLSVTESLASCPLLGQLPSFRMFSLGLCHVAWMWVFGLFLWRAGGLLYDRGRDLFRSRLRADLKNQCLNYILIEKGGKSIYANQAVVMLPCFYLRYSWAALCLNDWQTTNNRPEPVVGEATCSTYDFTVWLSWRDHSFSYCHLLILS